MLSVAVIMDIKWWNSLYFSHLYIKQHPLWILWFTLMTTDFKQMRSCLDSTHKNKRPWFKSAVSPSGAQEQKICQRYDQLMEAWEKKVERMENNPRRKAKESRTREYYERQFPEIRKQREQQERFQRWASFIILRHLALVWWSNENL